MNWKCCVYYFGKRQNGISGNSDFLGGILGGCPSLGASQRCLCMKVRLYKCVNTAWWEQTIESYNLSFVLTSVQCCLPGFLSSNGHTLQPTYAWFASVSESKISFSGLEKTESDMNRASCLYAGKIYDPLRILNKYLFVYFIFFLDFCFQ